MNYSADSLRSESQFSESCFSACQSGPLSAMNGAYFADHFLKTSAEQLASLFPDGIEHAAQICVKNICPGPSYALEDGVMHCERAVSVNLSVLEDIAIDATDEPHE